MPRTQPITTNFSAGAFSPRLRGRVDLEKYNSAAAELLNVVVFRQGGATIRPSFDYLGNAKSQNEFSPTRLIPFVYSRTDSYVLEFGNQYIRFWKNGALIEVSGTPVEVATPYLLPGPIDYTQGGDTLILFHPDYPIKRLRRFADDRWVLDDAPLEPGALYEFGHASSTQTLTLSASTVGTGRTATLSAGSLEFRNADVGRTITCAGGSFTITGYTSTTVVTGTITQAFAGTVLASSSYRMQGTPLSPLTPSAATPLGASIVLNTGGTVLEAAVGISAISWALNVVTVDTSSAHGYSTGNSVLVSANTPVGYNGTYTITVTSSTQFTYSLLSDPGTSSLLGYVQRIASTPAVAFRAADDVGRYIEINGGLVKITSVDSTSSVRGTIVRELTGVATAPADAWVLKSNAWNSFDGYPRTGTLFQQRLWVGGTAAFPLSVWGSRTGLFFDFTPGTLDDSAVYKTFDSDENNIIQWLTSGWGGLIALTLGNEFDIRGGIEKPITQLNAQITRRSRWGAYSVRPEEAGDDILFVDRGGDAVRAISQNEAGGFRTQDVGVFSEHLLAAGVAGMSFEQKPEQVLWVIDVNGRILAVTYNSEQSQVTFCDGETVGRVESICTVPEGAIDVTYATVLRTANGAGTRYVEKLNWAAPPGQDSRKTIFNEPPLTTWSGFTHLAGQTVSVLADGVDVGQQVVTAGGQITIPRAAFAVSVGLPYTARIKLWAPEVGTGTGTSQAQAQSTNRVFIRFLDTIGCKMNGQEVAFRQFGEDVLDEPPTPFSGIKDVSELGWEAGESDITLEQTQPYQWTVLAVVRNFTVNAG